MKVLLIIPPMSNLTMSYPATAYLTGYLRSIDIQVDQADWSLELACRLYLREGLERLHLRVSQTAFERFRGRQKNFLTNYERYRETVEGVVRFLQGRDPSLERRILSRRLLPEGPSLRQLFHKKKESWIPRNLYALGDPDRARIMASLYLNDLSQVMDMVTPGFQLESYQKQCEVSLNFDDFKALLDGEEGSLFTELITEITAEGLRRYQPDVVGLTVPFPGNLPGSFLIAQTIKHLAPGIKIVLGGGYPNTCLRKLSDPRVFDYVDFITLDDGERPLACLLEFLSGERDEKGLLRTFLRKDGKVAYCSSPQERDLPFAESVTPVYTGLPLDRYLAILFCPNPAVRLWSRRWNKLTLAHGCYWGKCSFCDTALDYIKCYEPQQVDRLVEHIEQLIGETGLTGFQWVDEAAPPSLLHALSRRLLEKHIAISWWGNVRFERAFTPEVVKVMAEAGCIMITAGLEVASDELLKKMKKGVSVAQAARVGKLFNDNGVLVHAYLMYGFPGETTQETINSLEIVRQMFAAGCLHSAHWHRFMVTDDSLIRQNPDEYGIKLLDDTNDNEKVFSLFEHPYEDPTDTDHKALGVGLNNALFAYKEGLDIDKDVRKWFEISVPRTTVAKNFIKNALIDSETVKLPSFRNRCRDAWNRVFNSKMSLITLFFLLPILSSI
jgi:radical SAM superfamily enzyme YgiQ (UPF0313 family)